MGYHQRVINKGRVGESSKIVEEVEELLDAEAQGNDLMALLELSDLIGAIRAYVVAKHPSITLDALIKMADATASAFKDGTRK